MSHSLSATPESKNSLYPIHFEVVLISTAKTFFRNNYLISVAFNNSIACAAQLNGKGGVSHRNGDSSVVISSTPSAAIAKLGK